MYVNKAYRSCLKLSHSSINYNENNNVWPDENVLCEATSRHILFVLTQPMTLRSMLTQVSQMFWKVSHTALCLPLPLIYRTSRCSHVSFCTHDIIAKTVCQLILESLFLLLKVSLMTCPLLH